MKTVSPSLSLHLAQETTTLARLWKITRADGSVKGYTDFDQDILFADGPAGGVVAPALQVLVASGTSGIGLTQTSATLTPQDSSDWALFLTSYNFAVGVSGWFDHGGGILTMTPSGGSPLTVTTNASGFPDDPWTNLIASFSTNGSPTRVQSGGGAGGGLVNGQVFDFPFASPTTAGNRILVFILGAAIAPTVVPTISDTSDNSYTLYGGTYLSPLNGHMSGCWMYECINNASGTLTVSLAIHATIGANLSVYEYGGITPPPPPTTPYTSLEGFTASAVQHGSDGSADNLTITGFLSDSGIIESDVRAHLYDAATVEMRIVNWADLTQGCLKLIKGTVGDITLNNGAYELELRGLTQLLSTQIGDTFSPLCRAELFGGGAEGIDPQNHWKCRLNQVDWVQSGTVASSPNSTTVVPSGALLMKGSSTPTVAAPADWFNDGVLTFVGGQLGGYSFEISAWDGTQLFLFGGAPMPFSPAPGDAFEIEPGCDKTMPTCSTKFNNSANHAGESAIPGLFQIGAMSNTQIG